MKSINCFCDGCSKKLDEAGIHEISISDFVTLDLCYECYSKVINTVKDKIAEISSKKEQKAY